MISFKKHPRFFLLLVLLGLYFANTELFINNSIALGLALFFFEMIWFLYDTGKKINALDLMSLGGILIYVLSPAIFYAAADTEWYEGYNVMSVPREDYMRLAIPGTIALVAGIHFPFASLERDHHLYVEEAKNYLKDKLMQGTHLFWTGTICTFAKSFAPPALGFVLTLASYLIFIGTLYIWYSGSAQRYLYVAGMFGVLVMGAIQSAMFGDIIYWGTFVGLFLVLGHRIFFVTKVAFVIVGLLLMLFIQSMKYEYRLLTYYEGFMNTEERLQLLDKMIDERLDNNELLFGKPMLTGALERTNQGYLTAMAMAHTPESEPFAKGETILTATVASIIPRVLWPDKPTAGGRENMIRFTGYDPGETTSMDIGQLGDAYVNFGHNGAVLFMFLYGLLFKFVFSRLLWLSAHSMPSLILWIPLFFAGSIQLETSVLSSVNHIFKVTVFTWFLFFIYEKATRNHL